MALKDELQPKTLIPVEQLVKAAGIDVTSWRTNNQDELVEENGNVYKNFLWAFGGESDPVALCVWHKEVDWSEDPPVRVGNFKTLRNELQTLSDKSTSTAEKGRIGIKIRRAYDVDFHGILTRHFHRILTHPLCEPDGSRCG